MMMINPDSDVDGNGSSNSSSDDGYGNDDVDDDITSLIITMIYCPFSLGSKLLLSNHLCVNVLVFKLFRILLGNLQC